MTPHLPFPPVVNETDTLDEAAAKPPARHRHSLEADESRKEAGLGSTLRCRYWIATGRSRRERIEGVKHAASRVDGAGRFATEGYRRGQEQGARVEGMFEPLPTPAFLFTATNTPPSLVRPEPSLNSRPLQISIIVIVIFVLLAITYGLTLRMRHSANPPAKQKKDKLPSLFSWKSWRKRPRRNEYSTSLQDNEMGSGGDREMSGSLDPERQNSSAIEARGVDRNTSVRSVMTLPAYSPAVRENEQVLAREGERGGIDIVVEYPETQEEEEARRDGEMESLYQIRLARRTEAREREERRQARREARARGDHQALAEIRRRAEQAAELSVSQMLIAEHQSANRDRRVSSVQYGDLGVARHDGTRLRANSSESDQRPLLDSAASFQSTRSRGFTNNSLNTHYRNPSASSMLSVSSRASDEFEFPEAIHTRSNETSESFEVVELGRPRSRSRSASRAATPIPVPSIEIPQEEAPAYEDPPNYESPVATRAPPLPATDVPQLPSLERLPSIHITEESTPGDGRPAPTTATATTATTTPPPSR